MLFNLAAKIVRLSPDLDEVVTIRDTLKELHCLELGTRYRALSAEDVDGARAVADLRHPRRAWPGPRSGVEALQRDRERDGRA